MKKILHMTDLSPQAPLVVLVTNIRYARVLNPNEMHLLVLKSSLMCFLSRKGAVNNPFRLNPMTMSLSQSFYKNTAKKLAQKILKSNVVI